MPGARGWSGWGAGGHLRSGSFVFPSLPRLLARDSHGGGPVFFGAESLRGGRRLIVTRLKSVAVAVAVLEELHIKTIIEKQH